MNSSIQEDIYDDLAPKDTTSTYEFAEQEEQHLIATNTSKELVATNKEIWGWYMFGWAADGYTAATSGVFQPIIISSMATAGGRSTIDHTSKCTSSTACEVLFGTVWVSPTSYSLYSSAIAVVVQVFITISLGALADHSGNAKIYMFIFVLFGCISVMLWLALIDPTWYVGANILNIVGNVTYGAAYVFNAGYLPKLARNHPDVLNATTEQERGEKLVFRTSRISIFGSAFGFFGGFVQMIIGVGILLAMNQTLFSVRLATFVGGVWWAVFAFVPMILLKRRPGPPLPKGEHYLTYPWKQMYKRFRYAYKLSQLFLFLLFWFFVSDAASTVIQVAVLFAQNEVHVSSTMILIGALVELISAVPGMLIWHWIQRRFKISVKTIIFIVTLLAGFVPLYIIGGLAPTPGGFKTAPEFIFLCAYYALMQPALNAFSRALFSELVPKGHENEMFSLFAVTMAGGGWIGPLVSGAVGDATGSQRYSMIFVVASMYIPLILFYFVDVSKGVSQARLFVEPEKYRKVYRDSTELDLMA
ncbi:autophagy-related protein 22-like protein [Umbelopsis sp. PMI_123]|nr:autophagy-related protein 22-like protein [Umbelopsis sp. PMI_123]